MFLVILCLMFAMPSTVQEGRNKACKSCIPYTDRIHGIMEHRTETFLNANALKHCGELKSERDCIDTGNLSQCMETITVNRAKKIARRSFFFCCDGRDEVTKLARAACMSDYEAVDANMSKKCFGPIKIMTEKNVPKCDIVDFVLNCTTGVHQFHCGNEFKKFMRKVMAASLAPWIKEGKCTDFYDDVPLFNWSSPKPPCEIPAPVSQDISEPDE